jgi:ethanolaminephosphotransferase
VTSFFVSDFKEVDYNVTRNLERELRSAWDMAIFHYLGLDHIGHVHGPNSPLVPPKLLEMDQIVKKLYQYLLSNAPHSMIILCGDHGMANIGGHGGNSYPEVTTPLIFLSTQELTSW